MFVLISLKPLQAKWRTIIKILMLIGLLVYVIPKLVAAVSGISHPPVKQKLRDDPLREMPTRVELKFCSAEAANNIKCKKNLYFVKKTKEIAGVMLN
ncbi:MAG TPA: hypothetical protein DEA44_03375 [Firmicutes bacterium]|nr:hypothetical protein [Bacillota bacterium]HWR56640.1 hypothetical protein [Negativicutes bacterium]